VNLSFLHSTADLQLNVYYTNSIGNNIMIDYSHSTSHNEQVVFNLTTNRIIIIWVFSSGGASWYNLSVESTGTPPPPPTTGDANEPNDSFATATPISSPSSQSSLTIHNSSDDDFFSINATAGTTYWVNISFTHSQGDLDMDLYDSSQSQIDWSAGTGNSESVTYTPSTNQTLYAQVFGWGSATNTYSVTFGGLSSGGGSGGGTPASGPPGAGTTNATILNTTYLNGSHAFDDLYIGCGIVAPCGSIVTTGDLILTVNTLTVAAGGSIIAEDYGTWNAAGVGGTTYLSSSWRGDGAGGAGHYGNGGDGGGTTTSNGGSSYGVNNETGSSGGAVYDSAGNLVSASGLGGGRIIIYADTIVIYGTVSASGYDGDPG
ncbi:MAG: PPC domain-containing protein, partial [Candidatus Poseidoniales archaeon]|nr:PPC domain-containing protein [Candidatus Poseidoniales archaeon]